MSQRIGYAIAAVALLALVVLSYAYLYTPVTTVYLVRHAERLNDSDTTSLSAAGAMRASGLAVLVREAGIRRIYVTEKHRTAQTAAPAADLLQLTPVEIAGHLVDDLVDSIKADNGKTILVVGHSDTLPAIIRGLGVHPQPAIGRDVFDDLFIVTVSPFRSSIAHLKYGARS